MAIKNIIAEMEDGEICTICKATLREEYGRPIACEDCGGEAVIAGGQEDDA